MQARMRLGIVSLAIISSGCIKPAFNPSTLFKDIYDSIEEAKEERRPLPVAWHGIDFRDTELYGLFARYESFDSLKSFDQQFPRVALTVIDVPPTHSEANKNPSKSCWRLSAKIWQSLEEYRLVEPFHWCNPRDLLPASIPVNDADAWFSARMNNSHTGNKRTTGPRPPESAIPTDLKHKEFWRSSSFTIRSMDGMMLVSMLYHMGFDWTNLKDRRVWVVEFSQTRWDSFSNR